MQEKIKLSDAQIRDRKDEWDALPWRDRRKVERLARKGQRHPNPRISRAAHGWALSVLASTDSQRKGEAAGTFLFGILIDLNGMVLGAAFGGQATGSAAGGVFVQRKQRRLAEKLVSLENRE